MLSLDRPTAVPFWLGPNNCRRLVYSDEGSIDDSHMLAMQVLSLAPLNLCNSDLNQSCYQDPAPLFS